MTGNEGVPKPCPLCGGQLSAQIATIPFVLGNVIAVIKQVPAEVCDSCGEPFLHGEAAEIATSVLASAAERLPVT